MVFWFWTSMRIIRPWLYVYWHYKHISWIDYSVIKCKLTHIIVSATRRRRDIKILSVDPGSKKFNIVSNDHGRTQKCDFCISVGIINFTDHRTPDKIHGFRDAALVCKMHDCYCTIRKYFEHFYSFSLGLVIKRCKRLQWLDYMKTRHFKTLLNVFSTTYTYPNCIVYRFFCC